MLDSRDNNEVLSPTSKDTPVKSPDWAKTIAVSVQNDARLQPWKKAFGTEKVNDKVNQEPDFGVYSSEKTQGNGLAA